MPSYTATFIPTPTSGNVARVRPASIETEAVLAAAAGAPKEQQYRQAHGEQLGAYLRIRLLER